MSGNPYRSPSAQLAHPALPPLGSLAQSARAAELRKARGLLLFVGLVGILMYGFFFLRAEHQVERAIERQVQQLERRGLALDMKKVEQLKREAVRTTRRVNALAVGAAATFLVIGCYVPKYPVPATCLGLLGYLAGLALLVIIDQATLWKGLVVNIVIVLALIRAVQAAIAYESARGAETPAENPPDRRHAGVWEVSGVSGIS